MNYNVSKRFCLQAIGACLLLMITACKPIETTENPTLQPETENLAIEPPPGTLMSWWDGSTIAYIPQSEFIMGDPEATEGDNIPAHTVSVDGFWIQQTEVTNRMYAQCVAAGVCQAPTPDPSYPDHYTQALYANHPVASPTWQEAVDYCTWIGGKLPSEAEWELTARGDTSNPYPWGVQAPNCSRLNFFSCIPQFSTTLVGSYPLGLSPFNAADMAGNVFEWVNDLYGQDYYAISPTENPTGPENGEFRVVRSSSFRSKAESVPVILRFHQDPETGRADLGFRCMLSEETVNNPPAPICATLSYEPIPREPPSIPSHATSSPAFSLDVFCGLDGNGDQYGSAIIHFESGTDVESLAITSSQGTLHCTQDANDPLMFTCVGSALQPGNTVAIEACPAFPQTCPCQIEGLTTSQEGSHIRVNWHAAPQECAKKNLLQLQCDGVNVSSIIVPGAQTELVIDDCPQPNTSQKVCVSCIDPDDKLGEPACSGQVSSQTLTCPVFYKFNPATNMCEYQPIGLVQCVAPDVAVPGYGCLPAPQSGNCPVGFYAASYNDQPVCISPGGPHCQGPLCMATCPEGLVFNEALFCCEYPPDMAPVCPAGYAFDPDHSTCVPTIVTPAGCTSITLVVPDCPKEQPGPTGCLVTDTSTGGRFCAVPCPVGVPNFGSCTP